MDKDQLNQAQEILTEKKYCELVGYSPRTAQTHRRTGHGPKFLVLGRNTVRYLRSDVMSWLESKRRTSTSDPGPQQDAADRQ